MFALYEFWRGDFTDYLNKKRGDMVKDEGNNQSIKPGQSMVDTLDIGRRNIIRTRSLDQRMQNMKKELEPMKLKAQERLRSMAPRPSPMSKVIYDNPNPMYRRNN